MKPVAFSLTVTLMISFSPNVMFVEFTMIVVLSFPTLNMPINSAVV